MPSIEQRVLLTHRRILRYGQRYIEGDSMVGLLKLNDLSTRHWATFKECPNILGSVLYCSVRSDLFPLGFEIIMPCRAEDPMIVQ